MSDLQNKLIFDLLDELTNPYHTINENNFNKLILDADINCGDIDYSNKLNIIENRVALLRKFLSQPDIIKTLEYPRSHPKEGGNVKVYDRNTLIKILSLIEDQDKYELAWTLLTNLELVQKCDNNGEISTKEIKDFLQKFNIDQELIQTFLLRLCNNINDRFPIEQVPLIKLLPLALQHNFKDITLALINHRLDVNLSSKEYIWKNKQNKDRHAIAENNSVTQVIRRLSKSSDLTADLLVLEAVLLNSNINLNLWYQPNIEDRKCVTIKEYIWENLVEIFNNTKDIESQLKILSLAYRFKLNLTSFSLQIDNQQQLKDLLESFIADSKIENENYNLSLESQYILQILYQICSKFQNKNLTLVDFIEDQQLKNKLNELNEKMGKLLAADNINLESIITLLKQGANSNIRNEVNCTILKFAIKKGYLNEISKLLDHGVDINAIDSSGHSALHSAVEGNDAPAVNELITLGANINIQDKFNGEAPLHIAIEKQNLDLVTILLENGAAPNIQDTFNRTPLFSTDKNKKPIGEIVYNFSYIYNKLRRLITGDIASNIYNKLIEYDADKTIPNVWHQTADEHSEALRLEALKTQEEKANHRRIRLANNISDGSNFFKDLLLGVIGIVAIAAGLYITGHLIQLLVKNLNSRSINYNILENEISPNNFQNIINPSLENVGSTKWVELTNQNNLPPQSLIK